MAESDDVAKNIAPETPNILSNETTTPTATAATTSTALTETPTDDSLILQQPLVDFTEISLVEKVGHGSYGIVYKALWKNRDKYVAVKEFGPSTEQKAIQTEIKQLSRVFHQNIIALYGISFDDKSRYLIMEYAEGGSLHIFLHGTVKPAYTTAHAISWARQCAEGVAYLHAMKPKPLIHRDLKPLNLLLTDRGRHLKICDFGTVADKSTLMTNNRGSAAWMAPEVFEGSKYTEKCDIFSWAIVLWEILSRQQPFKDVDNAYSIMWKIHKGERPPLINDCPDCLKELMQSCWATVPEVRPTMCHVVTVMNELATLFPGADEPLEYEYVNQQIRRTDSSDSIDTSNVNFINYQSVSENSTTQMTPINLNNSGSNSSITPTNISPNTTEGRFNTTNSTPQPMPTASIAASTRWDVDVIPEENKIHPLSSLSKPITTSNIASNANKKNQYEISQKFGNETPLPPLSIEVDPNSWFLDTNPFFTKNDGKDCLTVTAAKPILPHRANKNNNDANNDANDNDDDDDDSDIADQSLTEMLDPELQPEAPIPDCVESQNIYREHRRLVKEYLRVDTDLYYTQNEKEKLLQEMDLEERQQKEELLKKMKEKLELLELCNNLKQQMDKIRGTTNLTNGNLLTNNIIQQEILQPGDDWVVIENRNT